MDRLAQVGLKFPTLIDVVERQAGLGLAANWWGPVIGSDESVPDDLTTPARTESPTAQAAKKFSNLFDLMESQGALNSSSVWWGPVIGSDETPHDGLVGNFHESLVQDELSDSSDQRLKTDIRAVGTTVYGLPLYRFRYTGGEALYEGVMAQDVLHVKPSAVSRGANGYYRVNYSELGLKLRQVA